MAWISLPKQKFGDLYEKQSEVYDVFNRRFDK